VVLNSRAGRQWVCDWKDRLKSFVRKGFEGGSSIGSPKSECTLFKEREEIQRGGKRTQRGEKVMKAPEVVMEKSG